MNVKFWKNSFQRAAMMLGVCATVGGLLGACANEDTTGQIGQTEQTGQVSQESQDLEASQESQALQESQESQDSETSYGDAGNIGVTSGSAQGFSKALFARGMEDTNPVQSPVSAYLALSLAGSGARGQTAEEFREVLGDDFEAVSKRWMTSLPAETEGTQILLANSAWLDERMQCEADWLATAADSYGAEVRQTKLSTRETMDSINQWIDVNTKGLIKNFLTQPLDDMTRLALINTIYFKGKWQLPFEGDHTREHTFTLDDGTETDVRMMRKYDEELSYIEGEGCDGVVLPYQDSELVFVALKPTEGQSVRQMCDSLDMEQIGKMVDDARTEKLDLLLPKFEVSFDRILNGDMQAMGLRSAFDSENADFSGIGKAEEQSLYISLVRQKAVFKLDEEGTEAAAVTAILMRANSMMISEDPREVHFDHPFLYMILDPETDVPLFMGIMDDPSLAQSEN